jgi:hydroxymethylpyrimidine/phosphomethylpyrimidine kinase
MNEVVLSIGGSDPSGGAGVQGDLKTLHRHGVYGAAAITLLTVQSTRGVTRVETLDAAIVAAQIDAVLGDLEVVAIKTGALGSDAIARAIADRVGNRKWVCDPVIAATSGASLGPSVDAMRALAARATLVTPNAIEAEAMSGIAVKDVETASAAARAIASRGARAVLVKGGHVAGTESIDVLFVAGRVVTLGAPRIETTAGHGTGCALASSIAARLAQGTPIEEAVRGAKAWVHRALANAPKLGHGRGPLDLLATV